MPPKERSRDNTFLDSEQRRWKGPVLLFALTLITVALVVLAVMR